MTLYNVSYNSVTKFFDVLERETEEVLSSHQTKQQAMKQADRYKRTAFQGFTPKFFVMTGLKQAA